MEFILLIGTLLVLIQSNQFYSKILTFIITLAIFLLSLLNLTIYQLDYTTIFVLLTTLVFPSTILSNWNNINDQKSYCVSMLLLEFSLLIVFKSTNVITFYVFFEASLIPLFIIINLFGGDNRSRASYLLFLYTLIGSLFILVAFILLVIDNGTIYFLNIEATSNHFIWLILFISLIVKTPLIPFHIWLPRAHSEAPVGGSIILASLVLKMATFGYLKLLLELIPELSSFYTPLVQIICILSIFYSSLSAIRQIDTKVLVAITSVAHISIVVLGLFSNNFYGLVGALILSLGHGFISPILFFIVGGIIYDRFHVRIIRYYRGLINRMPILTTLFFLTTIGNIGVPLTFNFIGEFLSLIGTYDRIPIISILAAFSIVLSATYSIWFYAKLFLGQYSTYLNYGSDINRREFHVILPWLLLTFILGIYPNNLLILFYESLSNFLYKVSV